MKHSNNPSDNVTIGMDLGDKWSHFVVLDAAGEITESGRVRTRPQDLGKRFGGYSGATIAIEVGTHSPWVSRRLEASGLKVLVANSRQIPIITQNIKKSDTVDPELLARLARSDPRLLKPVTHRGEDSQRHLAYLKSRNALVETRTKLINHVRGTVKSFGARLVGVTVENFPKKAPQEIPEELRAVLLAVVELIGELSVRIRRFEKKIEELCEERYRETQTLRQVRGVGPLTALAFALIVEDPKRFPKRRSIGAYLGLAPKQSDSGERSPQLRISKAGDALLRRLLINSAHYIMGPFGEDCDLRRHGERIALRGGKNAKKRALVAVARKLAVLLLALWEGGGVYEPLRNTRREQPKVSA